MLELKEGDWVRLYSEHGSEYVCVIAQIAPGIGKVICISSSHANRFSDIEFAIICGQPLSNETISALTNNGAYKIKKVNVNIKIKK